MQGAYAAKMKKGDAIPRFSNAWWGAKLPWVGFLTSIAGSAGMIGLTIFKRPSPFEIGLLQFLILLTGLWGAYLIGRHTALQAAREIIRPQARSAFRRVLALYSSLTRLSIRIEEMKTESTTRQLDIIQALVDEQIRTGQDSMEDWRDIIPKEVEEIEQRNRQNAADR